VIPDARVSWHHAVLRLQDGRWVLADNGSTNGTYDGNRRVDRVEINGKCLVRLADPVDGPVLSCVVGQATATPGDGRGDGTLEIPYAVRWLVPKGERFANFDILNDNDTQLDYYRRFGHVYAVGIPTKKWRLVVVSDPGLLDEIAADEAGAMPADSPPSSRCWRRARGPEASERFADAWGRRACAPSPPGFIM
jgi:pSer/pThr/pTyr-binding forkhead associated (FHA) protein